VQTGEGASAPPVITPAPLGAAAVERLQLACSLAREEREAATPGGTSGMLGAHLLDCWTALVCDQLGADARWLVSPVCPAPPLSLEALRGLLCSALTLMNPNPNPSPN